MGTTNAVIEIGGGLDSYKFPQPQTNLTDGEGNPIEVSPGVLGATLDFDALARVSLADRFYLDFGAEFAVATGKKSYDRVTSDDYAPVDPGVDCAFEPELCQDNVDNGTGAAPGVVSDSMRAGRVALSPEVGVGYDFGRFHAGARVGGVVLGRFVNGSAMTVNADGVANAAPTDFTRHTEFWFEPRASYEVTPNLLVYGAWRTGFGSAQGTDVGVNSGRSAYDGAVHTNLTGGLTYILGKRGSRAEVAEPFDIEAALAARDARINAEYEDCSIAPVTGYPEDTSGYNDWVMAPAEAEFGQEASGRYYTLHNSEAALGRDGSHWGYPEAREFCAEELRESGTVGSTANTDAAVSSATQLVKVKDLIVSEDQAKVGDYIYNAGDGKVYMVTDSNSEELITEVTNLTLDQEVRIPVQSVAVFDSI